MIVFIEDSGMINRISGEPVTHVDIDNALDAGEKVFVSFGGDPVEVIKVETIVVES